MSDEQPALNDQEAVYHDAALMTASAPFDVKLTADTLIACWLVFGVTWYLGSAVYVAPLAVLVKVLVGMQEYGYLGDFVFVFLYWSLFGIWLPWSMRKGPRDVDALLSRGAKVHVIITVVSYPPLFLLTVSR